MWREFIQQNPMLNHCCVLFGTIKTKKKENILTAPSGIQKQQLSNRLCTYVLNEKKKRRKKLTKKNKKKKKKKDICSEALHKKKCSATYICNAGKYKFMFKQQHQTKD